MITPPKAHNIAPYAFDITPATTEISADAGNTAAYGSCTLLCKVTGDLKITTSDGQVLTFAAVPAYTIIPIQVKRVWSVGTTGNWVGMVCTNG